MIDLDANFLRDLVSDYTRQKVHGTQRKLRDSEAARLSKIADRLETYAERGDPQAYERGFAAGRAYRDQFSNIAEPSKEEMRREIARKSEGRDPSNLIPDVDVDLEDLGL